MRLDLTKPVQTRDGRKVRILCTDAKGDWPIVGLIESYGEESPEVWLADGSCYDGDESSEDLVYAPEKVTLWLNVYQGQHNIRTVSHLTEEDADKHIDGYRIACVPVEITLPAKG